MDAVPNYGPWDHGYPPAELTPDEEKRVEEALKPPSIEEIMTKWGPMLKKINEYYAMTPEERDEHDKNRPMSVICYSPPYPPVDPEHAKLWSVLLSAGILDVQIVKQEGKLGFVLHKAQSVTLEKDKFYPFEPNGGEEQQKAFGKS
jgi:hypothetical protein